MNSRERIIAALHNRERDHTPWCPFPAFWWECDPQAKQFKTQREFFEAVGADPLYRGAPCPVKIVPPDELKTKIFKEGAEIVTVFETPVGTLREAVRPGENGESDFLMEHVLKSEEDWKIRLWIEEHTRLEYDATEMRQHLTAAGDDCLNLGLLIPYPRQKSAFQLMTEHLAGTQELAYALCDFPEVVEELYVVMVQRNLEAVRLAARSDYDYFISFEDSSTQNYSPAQYRQFIQPEIAGWVKELAGHEKHYIQHACGHVKALLPMMKESGVLGVESLSPPPTGNISHAEAREYFACLARHFPFF